LLVLQGLFAWFDARGHFTLLEDVGFTLGGQRCFEILPP
jgi:hypothetical protein